MIAHGLTASVHEKTNRPADVFLPSSASAANPDGTYFMVAYAIGRMARRPIDPVGFSTSHVPWFPYVVLMEGENMHYGQLCRRPNVVQWIPPVGLGQLRFYIR
jgi:hypothetical protein